MNSGILDGKPGFFGIRKDRIHAPEEEVETFDLTTKFDRFNFVETRKTFYTLSIILLIAGAIMLSVFKLNLGIDFSSGTRVEILSNEPINTKSSFQIS